jgi:lipoate synthase
MKLIKTIEKIIKEAEESYNNALESVVDEKELSRIEKNYQDSLKLMDTFNKIKKKNNLD